MIIKQLIPDTWNDVFDVKYTPKCNTYPLILNGKLIEATE